MSDSRTSIEGLASAMGSRLCVRLPDALAVLCAQSLQSHRNHCHRSPEPVPHRRGTVDIGSSTDPAVPHVVALAAVV